jgi:hypothetical protein
VLLRPLHQPAVPPLPRRSCPLRLVGVGDGPRAGLVGPRPCGPADWGGGEAGGARDGERVAGAVPEDVFQAGCARTAWDAGRPPGHNDSLVLNQPADR